MTIFNGDISKIDLDDAATWDLIGSGNTKGCFQLESRLGRTMAKKLKPENIEQLSALIAVLRPGSLNAIRDGKSVSNHYIDKKNGNESVDFFHESLIPILDTTYGEMIYQEQAIRIAKEIAGFNPEEADNLRKAIGKKQANVMAALKQSFLDGCKRLGYVNDNEAEQIFGWIEKSQKYSFNKSHSVCYCSSSYLSAYAKAHHPIQFFTAYLQFAEDKMDPHAEIKELYQNATEMGISIEKPDLRLLNSTFILKNNKIYFGLTNIKGFGDSAYDKLVNEVNNNKLVIDNMKWMNLLHLLSKLNSTSAKAILQSGAADFIGLSRNKMMFDYDIFCELTNKESSFVIGHIDIVGSDKKLEDHISNLINNGKIAAKRKDVINNLLSSLYHPPYSMDDHIDWIVDTEHTLLGCNITCSKVDRYDTSMINYSCQDFKQGNTSSNLLLVGEIENMNVTKVKNGQSKGKEMAFLTITDGTAVIDSVICFAEKFKEFRNQLFVGNVLVFSGNKSKDKDSFVVDKIFLPRT